MASTVTLSNVVPAVSAPSTAPLVLRVVVTDGTFPEGAAPSYQLSIEASDGQRASVRRRIGHPGFYSYAENRNLPLTVGPTESLPNIGSGGAGGTSDNLSFTRQGDTLIIKAFWQASGVGVPDTIRDPEEFRLKVPANTPIRFEAVDFVAPAKTSVAQPSPTPNAAPIPNVKK
jgi:hypothetical protein